MQATAAAMYLLREEQKGPRRLRVQAASQKRQSLGHAYRLSASRPTELLLPSAITTHDFLPLLLSD